MIKVFDDYKNRIEKAADGCYAFNWAIHHVMSIMDVADNDPNLELHDFQRLCKIARTSCENIVRKAIRDGLISK